MASIVAKVSSAIFEDFQRNLADEGGNFRQLIQGFYETCDFAARAIEKVLSENPDLQAEVAEFQDHLFRERSAYDLMLKMLDSDVLAAECENPDSFLTKLFEEDVEFRRLATLLHWSEEISFNRPEGFSRCLVDVDGLHDVTNVFSHSIMSGKPVHLDMQFTGDLLREDEESVRAMQKFLFALLRCGRLVDAKHLLENAGLPALCPLLTMRQVITNPLLTPTNPLHDNYYLANSRMFFKQTARELIQLDNTNITMEDRCVWATLSGQLQTLLSNASSTDDRLWAYVTCAVEALLDRSLLDAHNADGGETTQLDGLRREMAFKDGAGPKSVSEIFTELRKGENNPFYALYGHLASSNWRGVLDFIGSYVETHKTRLYQQPHMLRFLSHLVLLIRANFNEQINQGNAIFDDLICDLTDALVSIKLHSLVPFYLFRLSPVNSKSKIVSFLQGIKGDAQRREILTSAVEAGLDVVDLCQSVYVKCKSEYKLNEKTSKADWEAIAHAWQWLTYSGVDTARDALVEANRTLRKMFLHDRMDEAENMLSSIPEDLPNRVQLALKESEDDLDEEFFKDAQRELDFYVLYFEAISKYNFWLKQVETSTPPELPKKISDEEWSRMDITKRTEYEMSLGKARECLQKYNRLGELLKKRAVELLHKVLCMKHPYQSASYDRKRHEEMKTIREKFCYHVTCLLVAVYAKRGEQMEVLRIASLLVDPTHEIDKVLSKEALRKLTSLIVASGGAALID